MAATAVHRTLRAPDWRPQGRPGEQEEQGERPEGRTVREDRREDQTKRQQLERTQPPGEGPAVSAPERPAETGRPGAWGATQALQRQTMAQTTRPCGASRSVVVPPETRPAVDTALFTARLFLREMHTVANVQTIRQ